MVEVTYHCPYCGALTALDRDGYLADKCVTREPLEGWEYAATVDDFESVDGVEFVCLGGVDGPDPEETDGPHGGDGCGRTFYLNFVKYDGGEEVPHRAPDIDQPRFDFNA